jgi:putative membrane protein
MLRMILLSLVGLILVGLAAGFAWLNPGDVTLDLGIGVYEIPVAYAMIAALAIGWLFGLAVASVWVLKAIGQRRRVARQLRLAEAEVTNLRRMPDADAG